MKTKVLVVVAIGVLVAATSRAEDKVKTELDKYTGSWVAVSVERDGKTASDEVVKTVMLTVKGDKYTFHIRDQVIEGTHKVDPTKKPKQIDAVRGKGPDAGETRINKVLSALGFSVLQVTE